jgi:hypothetical protein
MNGYAKRQNRSRMIVAGDGAERQPNGRYRLGHFALMRIVLLGAGSLLASSLAFAQDNDFRTNKSRERSTFSKVKRRRRRLTCSVASQSSLQLQSPRKGIDSTSKRGNNEC